MNRHTIIGKFDGSDTFSVPFSPDEQQTNLPLIIGGTNLNFGMSASLNELTRLGIYPTEIGLDLLILASHVYAADTRISRFTQSQDNWTREIKLIVPVSDIIVWNRTRALFAKLLNFLTGDLWTIEFRSRPQNFTSFIANKPTNLFGSPYSKVQLFSGGLDSLIGAIDNLESGNSPLFISHAGDGATSDAQSTCYDELKNYYTNQIFERLRLWMALPADLIIEDEVENTTRGRSFLFFALGVFAGTGLNQPFTLEAPENGLIALNVPLDVLRLGSLSTHTTHPFYMDLWNQILLSLNITGNIVNPYWNKTKGEMVTACKNPTLLQTLISETLSCSSPSKGRWKGISIEHCGYCLPCLIRRASIKHSTSITDKTSYTLSSLTSKKLDSLQSEGKQIRSFQVAINRLKKSPGLANLLIHKSGPLPQDPRTLSELSGVYLRGLLEVDALLKNVKTEPQP